MKYVPGVLYQKFNEFPVGSTLFLFNVIDLNVESPETFNVDNNVVLFANIVIPDTFNEDNNVVLLDNSVNPETFNDEFNVTILLKLVLPLIFNIPCILVSFNNVVEPDTFNDDYNVVFPFNTLIPDTVKLPISNTERDVKLFIYPKIVVVVLFKLLIDNVDAVDKLFKLISLLIIALFIADTSIGAGGVPPPPPVKISIILLIPRYNTIAATASAVFVATPPITSISPSCKRNLAAFIIACLCKDSISS